MKYINKFKTSSDFLNFKETEMTNDAYVNYVEETGNINLKPFVKPSLYGWVDLGLPSGLKWSAWNVGATKPEEYGLYFAWGETQGYTGITSEKKFSRADYTLRDGINGVMLKYNATDGLTTLELSDDAAYLSDSICRMPTEAELKELTANTISALTQVNGVNGCQFTSVVNGNSIFVPAAGGCVDGSFYNIGSSGFLWSSSVEESAYSSASSLVFSIKTGSMVVRNNNYRYYGFPLRPVKN